MTLTKDQSNLLASLSTFYATGLIEEQISTYRHSANITNTLTPPLNCPAWACVVLPCIKHIPSMKLFKIIEPHDAEVLRNSRWIIYDAASLMKGDIIRLNEGDTVPADCTVLSLGMDHISDNYRCNEEEEKLELMVDVSNITGELRPQSITPEKSDGKLPVDCSVELYCGSFILEGSAIAVVTRIGNNTLISKLIREGKWPPKRENGYVGLDGEEKEGVD